MNWVQLYVKVPDGNGYSTSEAMKRVDEHLTQQTPAMFCAPDGIPVQEKDGTWEVRVLDSKAVGFVKFILTSHYGFEIVREEIHEK